MKVASRVVVAGNQMANSNPSVDAGASPEFQSVALFQLVPFVNVLTAEWAVNADRVATAAANKRTDKQIGRRKQENGFTIDELS